MYMNESKRVNVRIVSNVLYIPHSAANARIKYSHDIKCSNTCELNSYSQPIICCVYTGQVSRLNQQSLKLFLSHISETLVHTAVCALTLPELKQTKNTLKYLPHLSQPQKLNVKDHNVLPTHIAIISSNHSVFPTTMLLGSKCQLLWYGRCRVGHFKPLIAFVLIVMMIGGTQRMKPRVNWFFSRSLFEIEFIFIRKYTDTTCTTTNKL